LNHCVTGFGKRLLKRWIARPLYDRGAILRRQSAISTFKVLQICVPKIMGVILPSRVIFINPKTWDEINIINTKYLCVLFAV
jgi:hypothetical protein